MFHRRGDTRVLKDERDIDRKCREGAFQMRRVHWEWKPTGKMRGSYGEPSRRDNTTGIEMEVRIWLGISYSEPRRP